MSQDQLIKLLISCVADEKVFLSVKVNGELQPVQISTTKPILNKKEDQKQNNLLSNNLAIEVEEVDSSGNSAEISNKGERENKRALKVKAEAKR